MAIYQEIMKQLDVCFDTADSAGHAELIHVPHHIRSHADNFHIRSAPELEAAFQRYVTYTRSLGATQSRRICLNAKFRTTDSIEGTHSLEFMDDDGALVAPVTQTTSIMMRIFGKWMICGSDHTSKATTGIQSAVREVQKTMPPQPLPLFTPKSEKE